MPTPWGSAPTNCERHSSLVSVPSSDTKFSEEFAATAATPRKIAGFYDVILPGLAARYQRYLASTDRLLDEPTVRVMERILDEFTRMQNESRALRDELPQLQLNEKEWTARLAALEAADSDIVAHRAAAAVA
jgi:hypothetical protein